MHDYFCKIVCSTTCWNGQCNRVVAGNNEFLSAGMSGERLVGWHLYEMLVVYYHEMIFGTMQDNATAPYGEDHKARILY